MFQVTCDTVTHTKCMVTSMLCIYFCCDFFLKMYLFLVKEERFSMVQNGQFIYFCNPKVTKVYTTQWHFHGAATTRGHEVGVGVGVVECSSKT